MKRTLIQTAFFLLLVGAVAFAPAQLQAQATTNAPAAPKGDVLRFHGKVIAIDQTAMTLKVGHFTYEVTSQSKIFKGKLPGTLGDGVVGDKASGVYKAEGENRIVLRMTFNKPAPTEEGAPPETK